MFNVYIFTMSYFVAPFSVSSRSIVVLRYNWVWKNLHFNAFTLFIRLHLDWLQKGVARLLTVYIHSLSDENKLQGLYNKYFQAMLLLLICILYLGHQMDDYEFIYLRVRLQKHIRRNEKGDSAKTFLRVHEKTLHN